MIGGYEYRLNEYFGLGLGYAEQSLSGSYHFTATVNGQEYADIMQFTNDRWSLVFEPKFYYPLHLEKFEIYSVLRVGYKRDKIVATSTYDDVTEILKLTDLLSGNPINISMTPIGVNYFPIKNVGFGIAGNVLNLYVVKGSLFVRF